MCGQELAFNFKLLGTVKHVAIQILRICKLYTYVGLIYSKTHYNNFCAFLKILFPGEFYFLSDIKHYVARYFKKKLLIKHNGYSHKNTFSSLKPQGVALFVMFLVIVPTD